eukprot:gene22380-biopygen17733
MCRNAAPQAPLGKESEGMQHRKCCRNRGSHKFDALLMNQGTGEQVGSADNAQIRHLENDPWHNSRNDRGLVHPLCNMYKTASAVCHPVLFVVLQAQPAKKMEQGDAPGARSAPGNGFWGCFTGWGNDNRRAQRAGRF